MDATDKPVVVLNGVEEIARAARVLANTRTDCLEHLTAHEVLRVLLAITRSEWNLYPHELTASEIKVAATGYVAAAAQAISSRMESLEVAP